MEWKIIRIWNIDELEETFNAFIYLTLYELVKNEQESLSRANSVYWKTRNIAPEFRMNNAISQNIEQDTVSVIKKNNKYYISKSYNIEALFAFDVIENGD